MSSNDWKQGLCNCCGDVEIGCCGAFCWCCLNYKNAENLNKSGVLYTLLGCLAPCIPILLLRQEARSRYNIEGDTCGDLLATLCCGSCVTCQVSQHSQNCNNFHAKSPYS